MLGEVIILTHYNYFKDDSSNSSRCKCQSENMALLCYEVETKKAALHL